MVTWNLSATIEPDGLTLDTHIRLGLKPYYTNLVSKLPYINRCMMTVWSSALNTVLGMSGEWKKLAASLSSLANAARKSSHNWLLQTIGRKGGGELKQSVSMTSSSSFSRLLSSYKPLRTKLCKHHPLPFLCKAGVGLVVNQVFISWPQYHVHEFLASKHCWPRPLVPVAFRYSRPHPQTHTHPQQTMVHSI